jgi:hypothetical protein
MVYYRLIDGSTVVAVKDCTCRDHDGPHWLYYNDLWRASNEQLRAVGNFRGFIVADLARVQEKRWEMERQRIDEIIRED